MSELEEFAAHATRMARANHQPECRGLHQGRWYAHIARPDPICPGCITPADRILWTRLAEEVRNYLTPSPPEEETLL